MKTKSILATGVLALTSIFIATSAQAAVPLPTSLALANPSFELGNWVDQGGGYDNLAPGASDITGWTVINQTISWGSINNSDGIGSADGTYFLDLTGPGAGAPGGVAQDVATNIGEYYTFSFALGTINVPVTVQVDAGDTSTQFTESLGWGTYDFNFTATSAVTTVSFSGISGYNFIGLDAPAGTSAPEPASAALLGLGTLLLAARRRRIA